MLVSMKDILVRAKKGEYGVIAPSITSDEQIRYSIRAAEEKRSPLILNFNFRTEYALNREEFDLSAFYAKQSAEKASVPIAINLDHGRDFEACMRAIGHGFTSVMIDASDQPFAENVKITRKVVESAHAAGVSVEAELGCVGMADHGFKIEGKYMDSIKTDPEMVKEFVKETDCDCLAISIGNAHGPYAKDIIPHIDFELLKKITDVTYIPLVLHGGSGTGDENLSKACQMGICKINVGTDLLMEGMRRSVGLYEENQKKARLFFLDEFNRGYGDTVAHYMDIFGSTGRC